MDKTFLGLISLCFMCLIVIWHSKYAGKPATETLWEHVHTVTLDGCEYFVIENSKPDMNNYAFAITHKGNCKNPIHRCNGGEHD